MPVANFGPYHVRKWFTHVEDVLATETGQAADGPAVRRVVVAAAVRNPYAGRFGEDLSDIVAKSDELGREVGRRAVEAAGGEPIQSYGKACVVGTLGEYEHGNAFLTQVFADPVREAVGGGKSWVPSTGFGDAPRPDEVVIAFAFASRGRLHARLGGLTAAEVRGEDGLR
jgi:hypothetical protein